MNRAIIKEAAVQLVGLLAMDNVGNTEIEAKVVELVSELKRCSKCNRPLVVLQHLDYYPGDVCGLCQR